MDRLDSMIHDLLDASKVKAGQRLDLDFKECDLDFIARLVADEGNLSYGKRFIVQSGGRCLGQWDADGIRRAIENLSSNAAKYSSPNTPITIKIQRAENSVRLMVHNHGPPISKEDQAILFQQFRRVRSKGTKTGWGLGLTIVKGIVEAHHGSVHVESNEEEGTTFTIELPNDSSKFKGRLNSHS
jgi:signal transduction histidine kinase